MNWIHLLYSIWHHTLFEHVECLGDIYLEFRLLESQYYWADIKTELRVYYLSLFIYSCKCTSVLCNTYKKISDILSDHPSVKKQSCMRVESCSSAPGLCLAVSCHSLMFELCTPCHQRSTFPWQIRFKYNPLPFTHPGYTAILNVRQS